ncbi:MAG: 2-amino-4-hydroxy-6-hydroxymethyldihydropteridine diphosphokinase [Deltaproteobacteria bacterium]|nr:2-amino-4-hydroxy-6-hydroxymethyldihydropteridine diphosphokinase [Deltaproteobacteria bacterium]MBW2662337.1 2-amino-4-hydroxy-6-hydroxymethyldihydropteridine diphosphokinase [Deltaproteobacteria bacterium]
MKGSVPSVFKVVKPHIAYISVGSNIGDRLENCQNGITALTGSGISTLKDKSPFYITEPVDYKDQDWFVNAVIKIETILDPFQLLSRLKSIQQDAGRINDSIRFGPRILDLDIIIYDNIIINLSELTIPHPKMHKRGFVLKPFCDIDSMIVHPVLKMNMQSLLDNLDNKGQRLIQYKCDY